MGEQKFALAICGLVVATGIIIGWKIALPLWGLYLWSIFHDR